MGKNREIEILKARVLNLDKIESTTDELNKIVHTLSIDKRSELLKSGTFSESLAEGIANSARSQPHFTFRKNEETEQSSPEPNHLNPLNTQSKLTEELRAEFTTRQKAFEKEREQELDSLIQELRKSQSDLESVKTSYEMLKKQLESEQNTAQIYMKQLTNISTKLDHKKIKIQDLKQDNGKLNAFVNELNKDVRNMGAMREEIGHLQNLNQRNRENILVLENDHLKLKLDKEQVVMVNEHHGSLFKSTHQSMRRRFFFIFFRWSCDFCEYDAGAFDFAA